MSTPTARQALITAPPEEKLGPAMGKLNENQRNYVWALLQTGGDEVKAASLAGFGINGPSTRRAASDMRRNPNVLAAIKEMAETEIKANVFLATAALRDIVNDPGHKDRLKAIDMMLNRGGMIVVQELKVTHEHKDQTTSAVIDRIKTLAKEMNMDPRPLLQGAGVPDNIIDAEFTVVEEDEWTVHPS